MKVFIRNSRINGVIPAPQSKSYAIRYIFSSLLTQVRLLNLSLSEDVISAINAVEALNVQYKGGVFSKGGRVKLVKNYVYLGNSAAVLRFFIPIFSVIGGEVIIDGGPTLRRRPINALIEALSERGIKFSSKRLPLKVSGKLKENYIEVSGRESSQHISGFMIAFSIKGGGTIRVIDKIVSESYIKITASVLKSIGVNVSIKGKKIDIDVTGKIGKFIGVVPGDYLLSSFYVASSLLTGGSIVVKGLPKPEDKILDHSIVAIYREMGARSFYENGSWFASPSTSFKGISIDVEDSPDLALSIVPLASVAETKTRISGISRLEIKESNRKEWIKRALKAFGVKVLVNDEIEVVGGCLTKGLVRCPNDHRIAMMVSPLALRCGGEIEKAECVYKSNPSFWSDLKSLGGTIRVEGSDDDI
ncbi:MAG: hypothetical protein G5Z42_04865 [Caldisphaeraceae archaeon]|nr:hypothetical protein [Caldisphaeraceae archaeon]MEB3691867.1 hypothetical protein [Caldisphaeraceae archaeon]MEB3798133.1 hypothetical protein [Caldisphaeraceae archaeon]